ncbi:MAG: hypothetical protein GY747_07350 [Planctomycetes bacterium]|nr:hypothetical protein [Planctomycetota bacterium]
MDRFRAKGSVLLMTLVIISLVSTLTISFTGSMIMQLQVARDQTAAMHAELSAQSGLEFAERQLLIDPLWHGTDGDPIMFTEGSAFMVQRMPGKLSKIIPTSVVLEVDGMQSAARTRFEVHLRVDPGDPLLDKALSVLGETSGSNLQIVGDYLVLDAPGWLWNYRHDLLDEMQAEENARAASRNARAASRNARAASRNAKASTDPGWQGQQVAIDKRSAAALAKEKSLGLKNNGTPDRQFYASLSVADKKRVKSLHKEWMKDVKTQMKQAAADPTQDLLLHVRNESGQVQGVWTRTDSDDSNLIALSRIDSPGTFHNFSSQLYTWAAEQQQVEQPIHAPGWDLDPYLVPGPDVQIFDHVTDLADIDISQTAVFILDPGQELRLENVNFDAGMVVWCEKDFDVSGPPRNTVVLEGDNTVGGSNLNLDNEALYAPGCLFTVEGTGRHSITGFSLVHSLQQVKRLHHSGVMIVLNSADGIYDSSFTYERSTALRPPASMTFFGNMPGVSVDLQLESIDLPTIL